MCSGVEGNLLMNDLLSTHIYLVILGKKDYITSLLKKIPPSSTKYLHMRISFPIERSCHKLGKFVKVDEFIETTQCHVYAEGYDADMHALLTVTDNKLGFIKIPCPNDIEQTINDWIKSNLFPTDTSYRCNNKFCDSLTPIVNLGVNGEIIVYTMVLDHFIT